MSFQYSKVGVTALGIHLGNEVYRVGKGRIGTLIESFGNDWETNAARVKLLTYILESMQDGIQHAIANAVGYPTAEEWLEAKALVKSVNSDKESE